jgi:hypothetical protein
MSRRAAVIEFARWLAPGFEPGGGRFGCFDRAHDVLERRLALFLVYTGKKAPRTLAPRLLEGGVGLTRLAVLRTSY